MTEQDLIRQDSERVRSLCNFDLSVLEGKHILITGATGLIGSCLIRILAHWNLGVHITAVVRNLEKAQKLFKDLEYQDLSYIVSDISDTFCVPQPVDYLIHAANQTSSKAFVDAPVETILTAIKGTQNMLEIAREKQVKSFVYLSSMEAYGAPQTDEKILESHGCNINTMETRSSYPESKRMCESLCRAYYAQYGVPTKVIRLSQTFGPGLSYNDGRVPAEFARCVIENKNIILRTDGKTKRSYLYVADAVTAVLAILLQGASGEAYNATNEATYCSIREMANLVAEKCANGRICVDICIEDPNKFGFAPTLCMNLDTTKLRALGWLPGYDLEDTFHRTILSMKAAHTSDRTQV